MQMLLHCVLAAALMPVAVMSTTPAAGNTATAGTTGMMPAAAAAAVEPAAAPSSAAAGVDPSCPPAPSTFTFAPSSCISGTACSAEHCDCSNEQLSHGDCGDASAASCAAAAAKSCAADASCHSFAMQARSNCSDGKARLWETYRFGGAVSAVPNVDWQA